MDRASRLHLWVKAETVNNENRSPLIPEHAEALTKAGVKVTVEKSKQRCFSDDAFRKAGCEIVAAGSWQTAPKEATVVGVENLPKSASAYWAGYVAAGLSLWAWARREQGKKEILPALSAFSAEEDFREQVWIDVDALQEQREILPSVALVGARGRAGIGAYEFLANFNIFADRWTRNETRNEGPFLRLLTYDVIVNCASITEMTSPFLTSDELQVSGGIKVKVFVDVTAETSSPNNVFPFSDKNTTWSSPAWRFGEKNNAVDIISLDKLAALLPVECSESLSTHLLNDFLQVDKKVG